MFSFAQSLEKGLAKQITMAWASPKETAYLRESIYIQIMKFQHINQLFWYVTSKLFIFSV